MSKGCHEVKWEAEDIRAHILFCRMGDGPYREVKKILLLKLMACEPKRILRREGGSSAMTGIQGEIG